MRRLLAFLLVLGLVVGALGGAAAQGKRGRGHEAPAPLGTFILGERTQNVTGDHLSFQWSNDGISNFSAGGIPLFSLTVAGKAHADDDDDHDDREDLRGGPKTGARTDGSNFRVRTANYTFAAHDNPSAVGKLQTEGRVTFTFTDGAVLAPGRGDTARFQIGQVQGTLRGDDLTINGRTITLQEEALIFLDKERGSFDVRRDDIGHAIAERHVGAEATFNANDTQVVQDVVSYGNVTMRTLKAERGNLTVEIEGHGFDGRVIVLNVDGRVLGAENGEKLNVILDDLSIGPASNFTDILDPDDDGYTPEYYIIYDPGAHVFQLIVTLPHYSVHTLSVTTLLEILKPSVVIGILAGTALLIPAALVLFRRK